MIITGPECVREAYKNIWKASWHCINKAYMYTNKAVIITVGFLLMM